MPTAPTRVPDGAVQGAGTAVRGLDEHTGQGTGLGVHRQQGGALREPGTEGGCDVGRGGDVVGEWGVGVCLIV